LILKLAKSYSWKANRRSDGLTIPVGGGIGKFGQQPVDFYLQYYKSINGSFIEV